MFFEQNRAGRTTVAGTESSDWDIEVKSGRSEEKLAFTLQGRKSLQDATHPFLLFIFQEIARIDILLVFSLRSPSEKNLWRLQMPVDSGAAFRNFMEATSEVVTPGQSWRRTREKKKLD